MPPLPAEEYQVGWICALSKEMAASRAMLDEEHGRMMEQDPQDHNNYFAGRVHAHNVVIACLPAGVDGIAAAATVANDMVRTFKNLRFGLLVGIGGGIPNLKKDIDIRLGDVVVSQPSGTTGGVIQYDKGKSLESGGYIRKGILNAPPLTLLTALASLQAEHELEDSRIPLYLSEMIQRRPKMKDKGYSYPGEDRDRLYLSGYIHNTGWKDCKECDPTQIEKRNTRGDNYPRIHYGIVASGNQVVKDSYLRDNLRENDEALCVEMEAAGIMNNFPCLVIRGICDYADSHKNDEWHKYAATTAAAYAKELLSHVSVSQTRLETPLSQVLGE
jgi:nucleoside phosphorylase